MYINYNVTPHDHHHANLMVITMSTTPRAMVITILSTWS